MKTGRAVAIYSPDGGIDYSLLQHFWPVYLISSGAAHFQSTNSHTNLLNRRCESDRCVTSQFVRWRAALFLGLIFISSFSEDHTLQAANPSALVSGWLVAQTNIQTWSADVIQVRTLKSLVQPLTATGHVWFAAPNRFRWEIGTPAQTIALRQSDQMLLIYPRLRRAERYSLAAGQSGPWKDALALLEVGFPRSQIELESRFRIASVTNSKDFGEVTLQPRSAAARRLISQIKVAFSINDFTLRATQLEFADGSTMRNEFLNQTNNPKIEEILFAPKLESDYKIVEPMTK